MRNRSCLAGVFTAAMLLAPFLALLFSLDAGLLVMAAALGAVAFLVADAARAVAPPVRARLRLVAAANGLLAVAGLLLLAFRRL